MNKEQAINVVAQACSLAKMSLQEHNTVQQAIQYLSKLTEEPIKVKGDKK